jgi:predicted TIM-barrel fold metal-dependent hydrolase
MKNVWFDVTGMANAEATAAQKAQLAERIRQLGVERVVYGSDAPTPENPPARGWETFRTLPLTVEEFRTIAANVAPYLR